jgi:C4-dicarboxylate transporter/malic acid transport protein
MRTEQNAQMTNSAPPAPTATPPEGPQRLRGLHPGWFAAVMGTAILAVATYDNPGDVAALQGAAHAAGVVIAVIAYALAIVLLVAYVARWIRHSDAAIADLRHPVMGALYGTFPGGLLVLAVMTSVIGPSVLSDSTVTAIVAALAVVGGVLALAIGVTFAYILFTGEAPIAMVNGGWFIPPVVTIIIPMALVPLMPHVSSATSRQLLMLGYALYGMGFLLFLFVMSLLHDRLVLHPLPGAPMAPSLWIGLGPVGVGVLALLALAHGGAPLFGSSAATVTLISQLAATGLWGFGIWWLAAAVALLVRYLRAGALPYSLGWWGFTFPLGAFTVATLTLARVWDTSLIEWFGVLLYAGLVTFWVVVSAGTVRGLRTGLVGRR